VRPLPTSRRIQNWNGFRFNSRSYSPSRWCNRFPLEFLGGNRQYPAALTEWQLQ